jgi:hypothetical protein
MVDAFRRWDETLDRFDWGGIYGGGGGWCSSGEQSSERRKGKQRKGTGELIDILGSAPLLSI